ADRPAYPAVEGAYVMQVDGAARIAIAEFALGVARLQQGAAQRQRPGREGRASDPDSFVAEQGFRHRPSLVDLTDDLGKRDPRCVKEHLAELILSGEVVDGPHGHAWRVDRDQQEGDAVLTALLPSGSDKGEDMGGFIGVGRPDFLACDEDVVAVDHARRREGGEIGARPWFGIALAPEVLARENLREVEFLLRL